MKPREAQREIRLQEWAGMVKARQESGMTVKTWCESSGISQDRYFYGLRQIRKAVIAEQCEEEKGLSKLPTLMKVTLEHNNMDVIDNTGIKLVYGGGVLDIPAGAKAEAIAEVLKAIRISAV